MITEDYTDFEIAKLLKEKGFECDTVYYYDEDGDLLFSAWRVDDGKDEFAAPTLQMAAKWLRIKYNLYCDISYDFKLGWCIQIISLKEIIEDHYTEMKTYFPNKTTNYPSCEEAHKAAIKYCLENLI